MTALRPYLEHLMKRTGEMIYLVEDDFHLREALSDFLISMDLEVLCFGSAAEYLEFFRSDSSACLILEMDLRDMHGLDLQRQLAGRLGPPIIFISEHGSVSSIVSAMKAGAIECLTKPVDYEALLMAIESALAQNRRMREKHADTAKLRERLCSLTPRQREVFPLVVGGLLNKQAAALLDISEVTLQIHRSQIMRKMAADSFAELVRMAVKLRIPYWRKSPAGQSLPS
jgi:FixJ family two-component response regulator